MEQTETAALKKIGETRNVLFERKLTHLYTAATSVTHSLLSGFVTRIELTRKVFGLAGMLTSSGPRTTWTRYLRRP